MKLLLRSSQKSVTTILGIALLFLLPDHGVHSSSEARSLRTSHKTHITDKDFHQVAESSSTSPVLDPRQLKWEYHLNVQEKTDFTHLPEDGSSSIVWEYLVAVHFDSFDLDPRCILEMRNKNDELVSTLAGMGSSFWSEHIQGLSVKLILDCKDDDEQEEASQFKSAIVIDEYVVIDRNMVPEESEARRKLRKEDEERNLEICRNSELKNAQCYETSHPEAFKVANSVVRMQYAGIDYCTGWMVSPGLLMTAAHCVETEEEAMNTVYRFNYASSSCDSDVFDSAETVKPVRLETIDKKSDYALVRMQGNPGFKYGYLTLDNALPAVDSAVYIPQHPSGRDIELAIFELHPAVESGLCTVKTNGQGGSTDRTCTLYGAGFKDLVIFCDTEGGSSGAPVLSATSNKVVGIHHCGSSCENFAVPITHIYSAIIGLIDKDIATAAIPQPTEVPSVAPSVLPTALEVTPEQSAGSTLVPYYSFGWTLGLVLSWMASTGNMI